MKEVLINEYHYNKIKLIGHNILNENVEGSVNLKSRCPL